MVCSYCYQSDNARFHLKFWCYLSWDLSISASFVLFIFSRHLMKQNITLGLWRNSTHEMIGDVTNLMMEVQFLLFALCMQHYRSSFYIDIFESSIQ